MTPERFRIFAHDLADLSHDRLQIAFARARRELTFFPKIAQLRELAGAAAKDQGNAEAEAAWEFANVYLRKWGVNRMPIRCSGKWIAPPDIPPRIAYALRRIGGLTGLNQISEERRAFMFRDFCEAYALAPVAESLTSQLVNKFSTDEQTKQLTAGTKGDHPPRVESVRVTRPKRVPAPMTDAQLRDRREMLKQQEATILRQRAQRSGEGSERA
jgi:hypothetical protein